MDDDAFALHAAKPRHLALCKLVYGGGQLRAHLLECKFPYQIERNEFVLETVVYEVLRWNRLACSVLDAERWMGAVDQSANLLYHAFFQPGVQSGVDLGVADFACNEGSDVVGVLRKVAGAVYRMLCLENRDFKSTDETLAGVVVCVVVERLERSQLCYEFLIGLLLQFSAELRVRWNFRK